MLKGVVDPALYAPDIHPPGREDHYDCVTTTVSLRLSHYDCVTTTVSLRLSQYDCLTTTVSMKMSVNTLTFR